MIDKTILDTINRRTYAAQKVVRSYQDSDFLLKVEEIILQRLLPFIQNRKLLDIGIGGGRTTKYLLEISEDYTGVDYTLGLAEVVKRKYPHATILCADARALNISGDVFDFALFSFNGIDSINHDARVKALGEIYRVLKPGGVYMFSTHNRDFRNFKKAPWREGPFFSLGYLKRFLYTLVYSPRRLMMRKYEVSTGEYAIVNDSAHGFSLLLYYIGIRQQIKQLESIGFVQIEPYDMDGNRVENDTSFPWTYYLARKPAGPGLDKIPPLPN